MNALLKAGKPSEALELLAEDPKLAWVKDAESGGGCGRPHADWRWWCGHLMPLLVGDWLYLHAWLSCSSQGGEPSVLSSRPPH